MKPFVAIFILLLSPIAIAEGSVKRVSVIGDQIVKVHTAVGIATLIQLPDRPNSVVIGDQDSFKVEYLDKAITVKPFDSHAKTNLYLYTDWKRYNVQLVTGSQSIADYVVYLEPKKIEPKPGVGSARWKPFRSKITNSPFVLKTERVGKANDEVILIEFTVTSSRVETFHPEWIWLSQGGHVRPINQLFLSRAKSGPSDPIHGVLQILQRDLDTSKSVRVEFRRQKLGYLTIPEAVLWK